MITFRADPESDSPAYHTYPDNEWRIEHHTAEWTVWRWGVEADEWMPVAITVDEGYPLPPTVLRPKGFGGLDEAQAFVRSKIARQATLGAAAAVLSQAQTDLEEIGCPDDPEYMESWREWQRATSRLLAAADQEVSEEVGDTCERCGAPLPDDRTYCEDCEAVIILEQLEPGERAV